MPVIAVDESFSRVPIDILKRGGVSAIIRYLRGAGKAATRDEVWSYINAGISAGFVDETFVGAHRGGYDAGFNDGKAARAAMRSLGMPDEQPIYTGAFDTYITPGSLDWQLAIAYQRGFNDGGGCGPQSAYGEMALLNELHRLGLTRFEWESESTSFPGNNVDDPNAEIIQRFKHTLAYVPANQVDEDDIRTTDWGQFPRPTAPKPKPAPPQPRRQRVVPLHDGKAHENSRSPYAILSPTDPTLVAAIFGADFKPTSKTKVVAGVMLYRLSKPADEIARHVTGLHVFVHFKDNTTGLIELAAGVTC